MVAKKSGNKKEARSGIFLTATLSILVFIIVSFLVASNLRIGQKREALKDELMSLQEEYQSLVKKQQELQTQLGQTTSSDYLEKQARENLNLKKPGEEVVAVLPAAESESKQTEQRVWWNPFTW